MDILELFNCQTLWLTKKKWLEYIIIWSSDVLMSGYASLILIYKFTERNHNWLRNYSIQQVYIWIKYKNSNLNCTNLIMHHLQHTMRHASYCCVWNYLQYEQNTSSELLLSGRKSGTNQKYKYFRRSNMHSQFSVLSRNIYWKCSNSTCHLENARTSFAIFHLFILSCCYGSSRWTYYIYAAFLRGLQDCRAYK